MLIAFDDFLLDSTRFELRHSDTVVELKPKAFDLLVYLVTHRDRLVTKEELLDNLWMETVIGEGSLSNLVYELRSALGDDARRQVMIQTVRGRGFRFVAEIQDLQNGPSVPQPALSNPAPRLRDAIWMIVLCAVIPNAVLAGLNYAYNSSQVVVDAIRPAFNIVVLWYNPITFTVSLGCDLLFAWRAFDPLRTGFKGTASLAARQRALLLGHGIAWLGILFWILAGILYPVLLNWMTGAVGAEGTLHFFASLVLCGLVAAVFPFFSMSEYSLRRIYPGLGGIGQEGDRTTLARLRQLAAGYLLAAGGIPLFSIVLLAIAGKDERAVLAWVSGFGLLGLAGAFGMYRRVVRRIDFYPID